jgi:hypothetical protein
MIRQQSLKCYLNDMTSVQKQSITLSNQTTNNQNRKIMNVKIETYRGFDILFVTESERFSFDIDTGDWRQKQSYSACKKAIDDYLKANNTFDPFTVEDVSGSGSKITIVGIRKDNRFIYDTGNGIKQQLSEYDEKRYMLTNPENEPIKTEGKRLNQEIERLRNERDRLFTTLKVVKLSDIKDKYINKV